ncbi:MAG: hypothetical protein ICV79_24375, partial [Flavisolibacter sp.]|nr:hypothetical protein [Flavisolibacter sp.]
VSEIEYVAYRLLKMSQDLKQFKKEQQVIETIDAIVSIYLAASTSFDQQGQKVMHELKNLTKDASTGFIVL